MTIRSDPRRWQPEFELIPIMVLGRRLIHPASERARAVLKPWIRWSLDWPPRLSTSELLVEPPW